MGGRRSVDSAIGQLSTLATKFRAATTFWGSCTRCHLFFTRGHILEVRCLGFRWGIHWWRPAALIFFKSIFAMQRVLATGLAILATAATLAILAYKDATAVKL